MKDDLSGRRIDFKRERFAWRDVWHEGTGTTATALVAPIPAHGVVVLRLSGMAR